MLGFFFQAEDGKRDAQGSGGLGDGCERQVGWAPAGRRMAPEAPCAAPQEPNQPRRPGRNLASEAGEERTQKGYNICLLYTPDAADEEKGASLDGHRLGTHTTDMQSYREST